MKEQIFMVIIPAILIFCLVFFNIRKMQKRAEIMRREREGQLCGGKCAGCAHSAGCGAATAEKPAEAEEEKP